MDKYFLFDDDDDDVRRVCKTSPGDPCGYTRQHSESSGSPLPSPWNKYWSVFFTNKFHFFLSFTNWFESFTDSPVTLLISPIHRIWSFPFFLAPEVIHNTISFSKDWVPSSRVRNIAFSAFLLWLLTKCLVSLSAKFLCLFSFLSTALLEFSAIPKVQKHQDFFYFYLFTFSLIEINKTISINSKETQWLFFLSNLRLLQYHNSGVKKWILKCFHITTFCKIQVIT